MMKTLILIITLASSVSCAQRSTPVVVGQVGLGVAQSIGTISTVSEGLQKAGVLPAAAALRINEELLRANTALKPLPDILRTIDAAQKAGSAQQTDVMKAIAILQTVSNSITTLLAGVPISEETKQLIQIVAQANSSILTVLVELGRLKR